MVSVVISQPMLFAWPGFFEQLSLADVFVHLDDVQFSKGSFTNRIQLKFPEGRRWMTIPLAGKGSFQTIASLCASDPEWRKSHVALLRQSLAGTPYVADVLDLVDRVHAETNLCDLLIASTDLTAEYLGIGQDRQILRSSALGLSSASSERVLEIVKSVGGTRYLTGHGAAGYLDHALFERAGIAVEYMDYSLTPWPQGGKEGGSGGGFTPYVSVLDLIARTGKAAADYLRPATLPWQEFIKREEVA